MKLFAVVLAALALAPGALAGAYQTAALSPVEDVSMPFMCSRGYDWDARYRDDFDRLELGAAGDKVWRSGVRFSLAGIPSSAMVLTAELWLRYDGTCVAPRRRTQGCSGRGFTFEAHPIFSPRWAVEREVEFGPAVSWAELGAGAEPQWVVWDVTDQVADWLSGGTPNYGLLLKLVDEQEDSDLPGPAFPSSTYADPAQRPRLVVDYVP
jgi:TGF-beta propeptide